MMTRFFIVNTDNFGGDYPNEKFVENLPIFATRGNAQAVANAINQNMAGGDRGPRYFKIVEEGYVLQPGFEP